MCVVIGARVYVYVCVVIGARVYVYMCVWLLELGCICVCGYWS